MRIAETATLDLIAYALNSNAIFKPQWVFVDTSGREYRGWELTRLYYETEDGLETIGYWKLATH